MGKDEKQKQVKLEQGSRLRAARVAAGFVKSAAQAAKEANWPLSTYGAHEIGTRTIGLDDAERYARFYASRGVAITAAEILFEWPTRTQAATFNEPDGRSNLSWDRMAPMIERPLKF